MNEKKKKSDKAPIEKLEANLELLAVDRAKHEKAVKECSGQRRELQKEFEDTKLLRKQKVDEVLENNFLDQSEKGLVDKVLTTAIKEPKLHQLQDSIAKLQAQEDWHRSRLSEISKQEKEIRGNIRKLDEAKALLDAYTAYQNWHDSYMDNEKKWFDFKNAVKKCHGFKINYTLSFQAAGIEDKVFYLIINDKMRPAALSKKTQSDLVRQLSSNYLIKGNDWYTQFSRYSERRIGAKKLIDPRRDNFLP